MKRLAIILSIVLAVLLIVCFFLPQQNDPVLTEPTNEPTQSSEVTWNTTVATQSTDADPVQSTTLPSETEAAATEQKDEEFVRIADLIPNVRVELAYATTENFTGTVIYDYTDAYLRYGTAKKLAAAAEILRELGYGILIWDGYRPVYAQQKLWDACPDPNYVSPPGTGTQAHCRGIAVDITLYDLQTGELLEMPSGFDEFSSLGDREYSDCTATARDNALLLETVMEQCGFKPYRGEWWHFSDSDSYEIEYDFDPALAG